MLVHERKKFHIRSYVVGVELWDLDDFMDTFIYRRHEIRIARESVSGDSDDKSRDLAAHVTNGALEIELLHEMPELEGLQDQLELFIANIFAKHLIRDLSRRVAMSAQDGASSPAKKFVVAGLDIMVTSGRRLFLLEANVNPIIRPPDALKPEYRDHLIGYMSDLVDLLVGKPAPNFVSAKALLPKVEES